MSFNGMIVRIEALYGGANRAPGEIGKTYKGGNVRLLLPPHPFESLLRFRAAIRTLGVLRRERGRRGPQRVDEDQAVSRIHIPDAAANCGPCPLVLDFN